MTVKKKKKKPKKLSFMSVQDVSLYVKITSKELKGTEFYGVILLP